MELIKAYPASQSDVRGPAARAELTCGIRTAELSRPSLQHQQFFRGHHRTDQDHLSMAWTEDHQATDPEWQMESVEQRRQLFVGLGGDRVGCIERQMWPVVLIRL